MNKDNFDFDLKTFRLKILKQNFLKNYFNFKNVFKLLKFQLTSFKIIDKLD